MSRHTSDWNRPLHQASGLAARATGLALAALLAGSLAVPAAASDNGGSNDLATALANARREGAVHIALLEKLGIDGLRVGVEVTGEQAKLTGEVHERETRELAKQVALSVDGVDKVDNEIELASAASPEDTAASRAVGEAQHDVADALLGTKVKLKLLDALGGDAFKIDVKASDGVVSLRGTVPSDTERDTAITTARNAQGVKKVVDLLETA